MKFIAVLAPSYTMFRREILNRKTYARVSIFDNNKTVIIGDQTLVFINDEQDILSVSEWHEVLHLENWMKKKDAQKLFELLQTRMGG